MSTEIVKQILSHHMKNQFDTEHLKTWEVLQERNRDRSGNKAHFYSH